MKVTDDSLEDVPPPRDESRDRDMPHRFTRRNSRGRAYCATCGVFRFIAEGQNVGCYSAAYLRFARRFKVAVALVVVASAYLVWLAR